MPVSPQQIFDRMVSETRAKIEAEEAQRSQAANAGNDQLARTISQVSEVLPRIVEQNQQLQSRLDAIEKARTPHQSRQDEDDPYAELGEFGINRNHMRPVLEREVAPMVERAVTSVFEKQFGGAVREAQAVQEYQKDHENFDLQRLNGYLSKNPEVAKIVDAAREKGAYGLGIEYAETRRMMDEKITGEARAQGRAQRRNDMIQELRPDAQIVGGTGANGPARQTGPQAPTLEQMQTAFTNADSGDWSHFEKLFVDPRLPSEEFFQQLAQS